MKDLICMHVFVAGKVQGVWFRASTKAEADKLGLTGFAKNLADGRVEVMVSGERDKVMQLHAWLQHGPELAMVSEFSCEELPWQEFEDFQAY